MKTLLSLIAYCALGGVLCSYAQEWTLEHCGHNLTDEQTGWIIVAWPGYISVAMLDTKIKPSGECDKPQDKEPQA